MVVGEKFVFYEAYEENLRESVLVISTTENINHFSCIQIIP